MSQAVLVAYATKTGTTREVAEFVGNRLRERGLTVEVEPVEAIQDASQYSAVVLGSAVRLGKLLGSTIKFAHRHLSGNSGRPVAYFIDCLTMREDTPENRKTAEAIVADLISIQEPVSVGLFGGRVDFSRLDFFTRWMLKGQIPEGDWRNWDVIGAWTDELVPRLMGVTA